MDDEALMAAMEAGDAGAIDALVGRHRDMVRAALALRIDPALRGRVDASDIVQEASLIVAKRIGDFLQRRPMAFRLWFRQTALECLLQARRRHLADRRDATKEITIDDESALVLAKRVLSPGSPSQQARAHERADMVRRAVDDLPEGDREILLLRTFEGLSNVEAAVVLALEPDAASKRFMRALTKLRVRLLAEGLTGAEP